MTCFKKIKHLLQVLIAITKEEQKIPIVTKVDNTDMLKGKVALVTGGSGGIGEAISKKLVDSGCKVIIAGTNEEKLKTCALRCGAHESIVINMNDISDIDSKIAKAASYFGKIDILVHSAGVHTKRDGLDFLNITEEEYDHVMDINLKGAYFICQRMGKYMINNGIKGNMLLVSSQKALEPSWSPYRLSKLGISGITKGIAQKLAPYGIIVNAIGPGPTATAMVDLGVNGSIYTEENELKRYIMPEEVAEYALILVSQLGKLIIGDTVYVTAGEGIINDI